MSTSGPSPDDSPPADRLDSGGGRIAALLATAGVGVLLLVPLAFEGPGSAPLGVPHGDKLVHAALFLVLSALWLRALEVGRQGLRALALIAALALYGGLLELLQGATGTRSAEWGDFAADALGAALGPIALRWFSAARLRPAPRGVPVPAEAQADSGEVASR